MRKYCEWYFLRRTGLWGVFCLSIFLIDSFLDKKPFSLRYRQISSCRHELRDKVRGHQYNKVARRGAALARYGDNPAVNKSEKYLYSYIVDVCIRHTNNEIVFTHIHFQHYCTATTRKSVNVLGPMSCYSN